MDKNLQTLELDKVLALLAEQTTCVRRAVFWRAA